MNPSGRVLTNWPAGTQKLGASAASGSILPPGNCWSSVTLAMAAGELFREYARVFHHRRQIVWSNGLRETLGLGEEVSDEEAAQKEMDAPELLSVYCTWEQWEIIRGNDARAEYLEIIEKQDTAAGIQAACMRWFGFAPWVTEPGVAGATNEESEEALESG